MIYAAFFVEARQADLLREADEARLARIARKATRPRRTRVIGVALSLIRAFARLIQTLSSEDLAAVDPQFGRLLVPSLIVRGTSDVFLSFKWARRLAKLIAGTTEVCTTGAARMHFPDERAAEFLPLLQGHWTASE